jgi:hypothetical protein
MIQACDFISDQLPHPDNVFGFLIQCGFARDHGALESTHIVITLIILKVKEFDLPKRTQLECSMSLMGGS